MKKSHARIGASGAVLTALFSVALCGPAAAADEEHSRLSSQPIPLKTPAEIGPRTAPILEIFGPRFLDTGNIERGIELPTGAVWTPSLWVIGEARTAIQSYDAGPGAPVQEWANRIDIYGNFTFTPTERLLVGLSPVHKDANFSGYTFQDARGQRGDWNDETNANITTLFFEGEFGEIFPGLDPDDKRNFDFAFTVGRQPLFFQEGIMINDTVDVVTVTTDNNMIRGLTPDIRATLLYGWGNIHRNDNQRDRSADLIGLFTETDFRTNTLAVDFAYVVSNTNDNNRIAPSGDVALFGVGSTQRIGQYNTSIWANLSLSQGVHSASSNDGAVIFGQISRTPFGSDNLVYFNAYWGIEHYTSAARDPTAGGAMGQMGILFASAGIGRYGSALSNRPDESFGQALGYQMFFGPRKRQQLVFELGAREGNSEDQKSGVAFGTRFQTALWDRYIWQLDGFVSQLEGGQNGVGIRTEFLVRF
jgi:hypothetical protein